MSFALAAKYLAWIVAGAVAFLRPTLAESFFHQVEVRARRLAQHRMAAWLGVGVLVLLIRGALLPLWPVPKPAIFDEFSYILQADTFAHGRLTNPTHKLWPFFESAYELQHPTYQAKYPPAQAVAMATGQTLFGDPWFGVWLSCGAMAATFVWALQGWLPPAWAMFGGLLSLPLSIDSYWMNSYWGGAVAAIGGALVLGAYPRIVNRKQTWYVLVMGIGIAILANARPYEGLVFCIPVAIAFLLSRPRLVSVAALAAVLIPAFAAMGFYNKAVTGNAFDLPFNEYARQYAIIPLFNFQPLQPAKEFRTPAMAELHQTWEPNQWRKARSWQLVPLRVDDWKSVVVIALGSLLMLLPLLMFFPNLCRDRRIRLSLLCVAAALAGSMIEVCYYQHYAAPAAAALLIVGVQSFRHLRLCTLRGRAIGRFLCRALPILMLGTVLATRAAQIVHPDLEPIHKLRDRMEASLNDLLNKHVILVRYTVAKSPHEEWVYNSADIDAQDVIWAHDMGTVENARLLEYYKDRKIWLLEPDTKFTQLAPYDGK